ncbi:hypothetical protein SCHPADRAFT_967959 [Schizopora paradoxa]|uniref:Uncharacterized protein n=1 Tax=Schizopora paradoxa TaxID=27342 RepID=A0A0H2RP57_9AGAM|nr:hypothetical protein SCHPADRAFT_967959 [Schizopora paradoxa]
MSFDTHVGRQSSSPPSESRPCTCVQLVLIHNACASSLPIRHVRIIQSLVFFKANNFAHVFRTTATAFVSGSPVFDLATLQPVWLTLHIAGGQVLLPLAVLTFLFTSNFAGRHLTLINFCITWIIYSVLYCILLYSGQARGAADSPSSLCFAQASLIHGAPPMAVTAGLEMVLQLWIVQRGATQGTFGFFQKLPRWAKNTLILCPPYIAFVGFSVFTMLYSLNNENMTFALNHVYCTVQNYNFSVIVPSFCAVALSGIVFVEGVIGYNWYKMRSHNNGLFNGLRQPGKYSTSMSLRVGLFTLYSLITLSACILFVSNTNTVYPYMIESTLPLVAFLVFGTQLETMRIWLCLNKRKRKMRSRTGSTDTMPSARRQNSLPPPIEVVLSPTTDEHSDEGHSHDADSRVDKENIV